MGPFVISRTDMQYDEDDYQFTHHHKQKHLSILQIDESFDCERVGKNYWEAEHEYIDYDYRSPEEKRMDDIVSRLEKKRFSLMHCEDELQQLRGTFDTSRKHYLKIQIDKLKREIDLAESIIDNE